jgi:hypothetical protein
MGYIVNLTVILVDIFKTAASNGTECAALEATDTYVRSGRRDVIHQEIRIFVTATFPRWLTMAQRDPVLDKIIDLIGRHCAPP